MKESLSFLNSYFSVTKQFMLMLLITAAVSMFSDNRTLIITLLALSLGFALRYMILGNLAKIMSNALCLVFSGYSLHYGYAENNFYCYVLSALIFGAVTYDLYNREKNL